MKNFKNANCYMWFILCLLNISRYSAQLNFNTLTPCTLSSINCNSQISSGQIITLSPPDIDGNYCAGQPIYFNYMGIYCASDYLNMGDDCGNMSASYGNIEGGFTDNQQRLAFNDNFSYIYSAPGVYTVTAYSSWAGPSGGPCWIAYKEINVIDCTDPDFVPYSGNASCITSFAPNPGAYVISFWLKEDQVASFYSTNSTYISGIDVLINNTPTPFYANAPSNASNKIIDGWQKVDGQITIPGNATTVEIKLRNNAAVDVYFDDIRFHPVNSGFKSFVYDPVTLRLVAELDDRNYATLYEYDEEGQLIRVKKETERGIRTIKESRTSIKK